MMDLVGKHIVLTGGGAGIGLGILRQCVTAGAQVTVFEKDATKADKIARTGGHFIEVDLADPVALETVCATIVRCDGLVNNAGVTVQKPLAEVSVGELDQLWKVNQRPALLLPKLLAPKMNRASSIVNIASNHARASDRDYEAYAGTKGALVAMTRAMAWSLGPQGIRVNALAPGLTLTETVRDIADAKPELTETFESWHATGHVNSVDDIGKVAVFLLSEASVAINGAEIIADQGMSARLGDIG